MTIRVLVEPKPVEEAGFGRLTTTHWVRKTGIGDSGSESGEAITR